MFAIGDNEAVADPREQTLMPPSRNQRHSVDHGGKSDGINRQGQPDRRT
jgi:hypothetical protein